MLSLSIYHFDTSLSSKLFFSFHLPFPYSILTAFSMCCLSFFLCNSCRIESSTSFTSQNLTFGYCTVQSTFYNANSYCLYPSTKVLRSRKNHILSLLFKGILTLSRGPLPSFTCLLLFFLSLILCLCLSLSICVSLFLSCSPVAWSTLRPPRQPLLP